MPTTLQIRNSTAEFLIFQLEDKANGIEVFYKDETLWASQKAIAALFDVERPAITKYLNNIFESGELDKNQVCSILEHTAEDKKEQHRTESLAQFHTKQYLCRDYQTYKQHILWQRNKN